MASRASLIQSRSIYVGTSNAVAPPDGDLVVSGGGMIGVSSQFTYGGTAKLSVYADAPITFALSNTDAVYFRRYGVGQYQFQTTNNGGNTGDLSLQSYGGNVGIGTTAPAQKLDVEGSIRATGGGFEPSTSAWINAAFTTKINGSPYGGGLALIDGTTGWAQYTIGSGANLVFAYGATSGATSEKMRITSGGNVSIGTTANPGSRANIYLSEAGATPNAILRLQNNGSQYLAKMILTDGNTNDAVIGYQGGVTSATQYLGFGLGTAITQMVLNASGNVGIGTTSPATKLDVNGGINIANGNNLTWGGTYAAGIPTIAGYNAGTGGALYFYPNGSTSGEKMRLNASGNLSIGNTNDTYKLDVSGTGRFTSLLQVNGPSGEARTDLHGINLYNANNDYRISFDSQSGTRGFIRYNVDIAGSTFHGHIFSAGDYNGSVTDLMLVRADGNVGIGTTSPSQLLHVNGTSQLLGANFGIAGNNDFANYAIKGDAGGSVLIYNWYSGHIFQTNGGEERMRITNAGNVGIGTTSPNAKLVSSKDVTSNDFNNLGAVQLKVIGTTYPNKQMLIGFETDNNYGLIQTLNDGTAWDSYNLAIQPKGGNVGIGTTAPQAPLHVIAASNTNDALIQEWSYTSGTIDVYSLMLKQTVTSGVVRYNFSMVNASTAYNDVLVLDRGNVGIGTTSPSYLLDVNGSGRIGSGIGTGVYVGNTSHAVWTRTGGTNGNMALYSGGSDRITIVGDTGNVGIGTTAPAEKLQVIGNIGVGAGTYNGGVYANSSTSAVDTNWGFDFLYTTGQSDYSTRLKYYPVTGESRKGGIWNSLSNTWVLYGDSNNTPNVIVPSGNVGIGNTAPVTKVHATSASNDVEVLRVDNTAGNSGSVQGVTHLGLNFFGVGNNSGARITAYQNGTSGYTGGMYFSTRGVNSDSAPTEAMRITHDQLIGLGPVSSYTTTHRVWIDKGSSTYAVYSQGSIQVNAGAIGVGVTPSATIGRIDAGNDIVAYSTSDERFKENITPIANALDKVKTLTGVEFDWRKETKDYHGYVGHDVGVIAQQVKAVLPEAVRTNANGYLAVRYEKIIGLLVEAMKEQQAQIEELKSKLK